MGNEGKQLFYPLSKEVPLHGPIAQVPMKPVVDLDGNEVNNHGKPYRMGMVYFAATLTAANWKRWHGTFATTTRWRSIHSARCGNPLIMTMMATAGCGSTTSWSTEIMDTPTK